MKATATLTGVLPAMLLGCLTLAAAAEYVSMGDQLPTATLDVGEVIGTTTTLPSSTSVVNKFLGIPFAASPPERFSPPVPVGKFQNPYIAQAWGPACIQQFNYPEPSRTFVRDMFSPDLERESEDCLYINVYAPSAKGKPKAVMFWIYGGGFEFGSAGQPVYDASTFAAAHDIIVVSANYRISVFGFSSSPQLPLRSQNAGFLDQRLALDWVQRNIRAFGGDPTKVTIFGESAGAFSVDRLVISPPVPIPFRAAISQSGQATVSPTLATGAGSWSALAGLLGCNATADVLSCVRRADAFEIKRIIETYNLKFSPVTDNITQIATPVNRAAHQTVPYLGGSNGQEGRVLAVGQSNLTAFLESLFPTSPQMRDLLAKSYGPVPGITSDFDAIAQIYTDSIFQCPAAVVATQSALAGFPTWRYIYNASLPNSNARKALGKLGLGGVNLGAFHSSEVPIVFGTFPDSDATFQTVALSKYLQSAWARFAKNPEYGPGWPRYGSRCGINPMGLAVLGGPLDRLGVSMIRQARVDYRCHLYAAIYDAVTTPLS